MILNLEITLEIILKRHETLLGSFDIRLDFARDSLSLSLLALLRPDSCHCIGERFNLGTSPGKSQFIPTGNLVTSTESKSGPG